MAQTIRIGTRGSKLALVQAHMVRDGLLRRYPQLMTEIVVIQTSGDWKPQHGETRLSEAQGGKGLFAREIENALLAGEVDCGVHSLKDMPSFLPEGLVIDHVLEREDPRDALLTNGPSSLEDLPAGAVVGTSSLRRQAVILARRPDLKVVPLRGNVPTRIEKLRAGQVDATVLAFAGLKRLDLAHEAACILPPETLLPAACQGIVGIETRVDDTQTRALLDALTHHDTAVCAAAERAALQELGGSCRTPVGAYAEFEKGALTFRIEAAQPDGSAMFYESCEGEAKDIAAAAHMGADAGRALRVRLPPGILE